MKYDSVLVLIALLVAVVAAIFDVREHRIPNLLTYPAMLAGVLLRWMWLGRAGLISAVEGVLVAGGVMLVFYAVRAMGAGDVKLMAAIGSFVGPHTSLMVLIGTGICGGVLGIIYVLYRGRMVATLKNTLSVLRFHAWAGLKAHPEFNLDNPATLRLPYGLAIALGTLFTFVTIWWR